MPVTEIIKFKASDAYAANREIILPAIQKMSEFEGILGIYTGWEKEDPSYGYLIIVWTTLEHHKRLMQDPSYPSVLAKLAPVHKGPISMSHFEMTEDPVRGLTAPETYFTYSTLKEGKTRDQINPFIAGTGSYVDVKMGFHSGWCMEKPNLLVAILGWASVEIHDKAMKTPEFQKMFGEAMAVVNVEVKHCKIQKRK